MKKVAKRDGPGFFRQISILAFLVLVALLEFGGIELTLTAFELVFVQWNESAALGSKYSFQPTYHYHQEMESNITRANAIFDDINCYTQIKAPSGEAYVFDSDCSTFIGDKG